eukprot:TRINITY_DN840_c0_g3_i1.p1 TRINITY_DN840_c0_g3~~TRINITY_DN840_c0_g3_i1.p1  ORF type:complete len:823 (-),score=269.19 TRINITY_DN840_c0_g3_i1:285-2753(-)
MLCCCRTDSTLHESTVTEDASAVVSCDVNCSPPVFGATKEGTDAIVAFLAGVQLFKKLPADQHSLLATACVPQTFQSSETIIRQGESGAEFYIIREGEASVVVAPEGSTQGIQVAVLKAGDYFGEKALLRNEPRTATISATTPLSTYKITRDKFQELKLNEKLVFTARKAVGGGGKGLPAMPSGLVEEKKEDAGGEKSANSKSADERALIADALRKNNNLSVLASMTDTQVNSLADVAWKQQVAKGTVLIKQGDMDANFFYIVADGSFEIFVPQADASSAEEAVKREMSSVGSVSRGGSFGELALLYLVPRAATVEAKVDSVVWVIDRSNFKEILMTEANMKSTQYLEYLNKIPLFDCLTLEEKKKVAELFHEDAFMKDDVVLCEGEDFSPFVIMRSGKVDVSSSSAGTKRVSADPGKDLHWFGDGCLMDKKPPNATVKVASETCEVLWFDGDSFEMCVGPLKMIHEIYKKADNKRTKSFEAKQKQDEACNQPPPGIKSGGIQRKDLVRIGLLGCGGFGTVELMEHKTTSEVYAMKGLSKGHVVQTGMQQGVMHEKDIMLMLDSPFIIKLWETYNASQMLYFLMEPALGGELYATYMRKGLHGSETLCMFYAAGVVYAFEHLHGKKIIYRDLKPENILITDTGRMKLTDMGLATVTAGKSFTTCGTPDYFAPEMIQSAGHTSAVDWWTLGILIFELMSGHPPFESETPMQIYTKVMKGIMKVPFPSTCQGKVEDLIKALLRRDPQSRLPMRPGKTKNLKDHAFFARFDWQAMYDQTMEAPYKPQISNKKDLSNFSCNKEDCPPMLKYTDDGTGWDKDFATSI